MYGEKMDISMQEEVIEMDIDVERVEDSYEEERDPLDIFLANAGISDVDSVVAHPPSVVRAESWDDLDPSVSAIPEESVRSETPSDSNYSDSSGSDQGHVAPSLSQIPFAVMAMHIFTYISSITINPSRPTYPYSNWSRNRKTEFRKKTKKYCIQNGSLYYLHSVKDKATGVSHSKFTF